MKTSFAQQRFNMLESQIRPFSVMNEHVLDAFAQTAREDYIPAAGRAVAYLGGDLPMGGDRFMIDPAAYARLLQEAHLTNNMRILDVGCLTGYSTAILSHFSPHVVGLDTVEWVMQAKNLAHHSLEFSAGDLTKGVPQQAPFDLIVLNGAVQIVPDALTAQVKEGGVIAGFWRGEGAQQNQGHAVLYHKQKGALRQQILFDAFVAMLPGFQKPESFVF